MALNEKTRRFLQSGAAVEVEGVTDARCPACHAGGVDARQLAVGVALTVVAYCGRCGRFALAADTDMRRARRTIAKRWEQERWPPA